jgi:hypothetical protein
MPDEPPFIIFSPLGVWGNLPNEVLTKSSCMSFLSRTALFLGIFFFSGAMVLLGAREMRANLKPPGSNDLERAEKLVHALRGDELFRAQAKYDGPTEHIPSRKSGSYLPEYDLKRIKGFLVGLIGGTGDEDSSSSSR